MTAIKKVPTVKKAPVKKAAVKKAAVKKAAVKKAAVNTAAVKAAAATGKAKGGIARAAKLTDTARKEIAKKAAIARWGERQPHATHKGNFQDDFGIDVECYVLDDDHKTAVISQRGMAVALGFSEGGSRLPAFVKGKTISQYVGRELREKLENPLVFQGAAAGATAPAPSKIFGYDVTILIDLCKAIVTAESDGKLLRSQAGIARQAHVILGASDRKSVV